MSDEHWTPQHSDAQEWIRDNLGLGSAMSDALVQSLAQLLREQRTDKAQSDGSDWGDREALGRANIESWKKKWPTEAEQKAWKDGYETGHTLGAIEGEPGVEQYREQRAHHLDYPRYAQTWQVRRAAPVWQVRRDRSNRYLGAYEWVRNEKQAVHFVTREAAEEAAEIARRENSGVEVIEAAPRSDSAPTPTPKGPQR